MEANRIVKDPVSFVSGQEVRSEDVIQHQTSTVPESIYLNAEANEIVKHPVEVVEFPLISVGDDEVIKYQATIGSATDVVNIYDYLHESSNH